jgi:predicted ATPase
MAEGRRVIEHIEIEGFKSLEKVSLDLGPLNIFVGTNASGKTNFLEALRVLQGIGYGYTVDEIFNGKPRTAHTEAWEGIRGGSRYAAFRKPVKGSGFIRFRVKYAVSVKSQAEPYDVTLSPDDGVTILEDFCGYRLPVGSDTVNRAFDAFRAELADLQFLQPTPAIQRGYSTAQRVLRMGDHGENFAALVRAILKDPARGSAYTCWLKELTPRELDSVEIRPGAASDFMFALMRGGEYYPAPVLSDGTLRFAAIAAAFFQPSPPHTLILEEIEDGLHPTRLQLLIELLKSQTGQGIRQVFATTHSPFTIAWLKEEDYKYVFLCTKNEDTGATSITPFSEVPDLVELAHTQSIADLFAEGWLENTL